MLNIIPIKMKQENNNSNNPMDKLLNSLTTTKKTLRDLDNSDFLQEHVSIMLDDKKLEADQIISKNDSTMSALLNKSSKYDIETVVDE